MTARLIDADLADYLTQCRVLPLLSIRDDAHLDKAISRIGAPIDRDALSPGELAYLEALSDLVEIYEDKHIKMPPVSGVDVLRHLMEENGLRQQDLVPLFGSESPSRKFSAASGHLPSRTLRS